MADDISLRIGVYGGDDIAKVAKQFDRLDNDVKKITQSFQKGRLTNQAYFKGINQQISALTKLGVSYKSAQKYVWDLSRSTKEAALAQDQLTNSSLRAAAAQSGVANSFRRSQSAAAQFAQTSRKGMRRFELIAQQAGYQVGDLAVQIQGGTNAAIAFGQQGSQLLGFFGPGGALVGAGLAISTAFVAPLLAAAMAAKDVKKVFNELKEATDNLASALQISDKGIVALRDQYGYMLSDAKELLAIETKLAEARAGTAIDKAVSLATEQVGGGAFIGMQSGDVTIDNTLKEQLDSQLEALANELAAPLTSSERAAEIEAEMEALSDRLAGIKDIGDSLQDLAERYEITKEEASNLAEAMIAVQNAKGFEDQSHALTNLAGTLAEVTDNFAGADEESFKLYQNLIDAAKAAARQAKLSKDIEASSYGIAKNTGNIEIDTSTFGEFAGIMEHMQDRLESAKPSDIMVGTFDNEQVDEFAGIMEHIKDLEQQRLDKAEKLKVAYDEMYAKQALRTSFAEAIVGLDADSAKYKKLEYDLEMDLLRLEMKKEGYTQKQIESYIELLRQQEVFTRDAEAAADAAERMKDAFEALNDIDLNLDAEIAKVTAAIEAQKEGNDAAVASFVKGEELKIRAAYATAFAVADSFEKQLEATATFLEALGKLADLKTLKQELADLKGSTKPKTTKETVEERLGALIKTAAFERTLIGVEEERATQLRRTQELTDMVRDSEGGLTDKRQEMIDQIVEMEAATRKLIEAEDQRQRNIDMFTGHLENAFMSIVDGSATVEDAFKGLMRAILMEIYQQQVAKPVASFFGNMLFPGGGGGLGSLLGNANGNAFLGGRVTPFAMGGVVNSPTFFPMANGTGLMGEAGPEAIMPLKRGPDGKLGVSGGGQTVINQTINVSTGVQQTVRNEIKSMMPQIAEQSKNAVLDAKRRGGSYGKRF